MAEYNDVRTALGDACRSVLDDVNVYDYVPKGISPPAVVIRAKTPTINYLLALKSGFATWNFEVVVIVGQVNEQSAQLRVGELISPESPLVEALNVSFDDGQYATVTEGSAGEIRVGETWFASALLTVVVRA